jgi:TonB family protein
MTSLRIIARCVLLLAGAAASTVTLAQVIAPSAAASAAADKAQKETDRTMYWIRVLAATPAAKPAAPKPAAPAPAPAVQAKAAAPERVKVAAASPAPAPVTQNAVDAANAAPAPVVVAAPPAAAAPSLAAATGANAATSATGKSALASGGLDAGVSSGSVGGALVAPSVAPATIDVPVAEEEPDPGLIMIKSADPEFPISTMRRLRKGEVEVKFEVGPDGVVDVVTVMKTTSASLNNAAVEAVRQWRFKPTPKGHTALVDLAFNLDT